MSSKLSSISIRSHRVTIKLRETGALAPSWQLSIIRDAETDNRKGKIHQFEESNDKECDGYQRTEIRTQSITVEISLYCSLLCTHIYFLLRKSCLHPHVFCLYLLNPDFAIEAPIKKHTAAAETARFTHFTLRPALSCPSVSETALVVDARTYPTPVRPSIRSNISSMTADITCNVRAELKLT